MISSELPDNTLTREEMPDFYAGRPYTVARDYYGRVAHIYTMNSTRSICHRHDRIRHGRRFGGYAVGDHVCKRCLQIYRRRVECVPLLTQATVAAREGGVEALREFFGLSPMQASAREEE